MRTLEEVEKEIAQTQAELNSVKGTETEVYARIVGYYRAVRNWNQGKRDEFKNRKLFDIEGINLTGTMLSPKQKTEKKPASNTASCSAYGRYEIFTRHECPSCPPVAEFMKGTELEGRSIDVDSDEGLSEAASKGVFASPTIIVYDADGKETSRAHSLPELQEIFEKIPAEA